MLTYKCQAMHPKTSSSANVRAPDLRNAMVQKAGHPLEAPRLTARATAKILDREMLGGRQLAHNQDQIVTRMRWM